MSIRVRAQARHGEAGFSLVEVLISMTVMLLVLGGTMSMMSNAMQAQKTAKDVLDMNGQLRAAMDLIQRDLLQVGQGLLAGRRIGIPNGAGTTAIVRPGPDAVGACPGVDTFPVVPSLPAVTTGPGLGPPVNGECTDVITILAADNMYGPVSVIAIGADGTTATMAPNDPDARDDLRPGDLLMLKKGSTSLLMQVTAVLEDGDGDQVTFGTGSADPLGLNQFSDPLADPEQPPFGTINRFKATAPEDYDEPADEDGVGGNDWWSEATRIRMITYFVDVSTDPAAPRLVRIIGGGTPNAVGFGVQAFRITYDLADQGMSATSVRMDEDDLDGDGACRPSACSENQVRKVNALLSMSAYDPRGASGHYQGNHTQNTLFTQVSLRNMAFVDRYR